MTILVTGGSGFVGRALSARLSKEDWRVRLASRHQTTLDGRSVAVGDIAGPVNWAKALDGVETVVHLAGRAHESGSSDTFFQVNVEGTRRLAVAAAEAGVRRLIFLSSVKVMGEESGSRPFRETDTPHPLGPYATSKWMAERAIIDVARTSRLLVTIVRSPLVYGRGVRANFLTLLRAVDRNIPLPFGAVINARSIVALDNLVDALICCARDDSSGARLFFVKDERDFSTAELIRMIAGALGRKPHILSVPPNLLWLGASLAGCRTRLGRVIGTLTVDSTHIGETLGWRPPVSTAAALADTADYYRTTQRRI